jgi:uncharacterized protein with PQ loop repeat
MPQIRVLRTGSSDALSFPTVAIQFSSHVSWLLYGMLAEDLYLQVCITVAFIIAFKEPRCPVRLPASCRCSH